MNTILVIDDDPLIADLIQALDPSWQVLPAHDGLIGLDILRQRVAQNQLPDLIILDIHMPGFDGYDTCILIRALSSAIPIVPFTQAGDNDRLPRYMQELHCMRPVRKGIDPGSLLYRLREAMQSTPETSQASSAVFERLLQKAMDSERQARRLRVSHIPVALFASSVVQRLGMKQVLEMINDPPLTITPIDDTADPSAHFTSRQPMLVASTSDTHRALALAQRHHWPLLLIAHTFQEAGTVASSIHALRPSVAIGVVLADRTIVGHLQHALQSLDKGIPYAEPLLRYENARCISIYSAEQRLLPDLSSRLSQLVVLDFFGWTSGDISDHFKVAPETIETYWSRVSERLGRKREDVRVWVTQAVERQVVLDRLRDYLAVMDRDSQATARHPC